LGGGFIIVAEVVDSTRAGDLFPELNDMTQFDANFTHKLAMSVATELDFSFLLSDPLPADRPRRLVHGDVGFHNMMMRDGRLAAILDWELTHIGDPAEDIGYIRAPLLKPLKPWDKFVATYVAEGGDKEACDLQAGTGTACGPIRPTAFMSLISTTWPVKESEPISMYFP
jgi:Phosphotransferase enzyme family